MMIAEVDKMRVRDVLAKFPAAHVLVVGDIMVDHFYLGSGVPHITGSPGPGRRR